MPATSACRSPRLSIHLDEPRLTFVPGDVITGYVLAKSFDDQAQAKLQFFGRTKTRVQFRNGNNSETLRGRAKLFDLNFTLKDANLLSVRSGEIKLRYPFSVTVPVAPQRTLLAGDVWERSGPFLSSKPENMDAQELPGRYYFDGAEYSDFSCFVEYVLRARLIEGSIGDHDTPTAILPVNLRSNSTPHPIIRYDFKGQNRWCFFQKPMLPANGSDKLSLMGRISKFVRPGPKIPFQLQIQYPTVIQFGHPDPVPFYVSVSPGSGNFPGTEKSPFTNEMSMYPIKLASLKLYLESRVFVRVKSTWTSRDRDKSRDRKYRFPLPFSCISDNIILYGGDTTPKGHGANDAGRDSLDLSPNAVDIGEIFDLRITRGAMFAQGRTIGLGQNNQLYPSFDTYNISLSYSFCWELRLVYGEDNCTIKSRGPCRILESSESQIRGEMLEQEIIWANDA